MLLGYIDPGTGITVTTIGGMALLFLSGMFGFVLIFIKKIFKFFKKHKRFLIIFFFILTCITAIYVFNINNKMKSDFDKKLIILGMDALCPRIMEPLMAQGRLPNFERLKQSGSYFPLGTTNPPQSPVAWSGFATGKNPGKTGVGDFISREPRNYSIKLSLSNYKNGKFYPAIKTPRFWQYTSEKNVPSVIIGCPMSFPPDKITGKMISGMGVPDILGTEGTFSFYTSADEKDGHNTGGKVFKVKNSSLILTYLYGPKIASIANKGESENVKVPMKINVQKDKNIIIEYQKNKVKLKAGQWSDWQEITFKLGLFKKAKGIFKFYLIETDPEFKLYVTPINIDPRHQMFPITYPKKYGVSLVEEIGLFHTQGMPFDTWALNENRIDEEIFLDNVNEVVNEKTALLDVELNRFETGLFYLYFESPDIVQHMFWRYIDEDHPLYEEDAPVQYKELIFSWYERMDRILGTVLDRLEEDDVIFVLSDHGFNTFRRAVHINTWLRDNGYLELLDPSAMEGKPLLQDIDWSKTKAYSIGFNGIYINEKGREGEGIVRAGQEKEALKTEIISKLEQWVDTKYKKKIINKVYKLQDVFWGAYQSQMPDLVVGYNIGYRSSWQTALGDVPKNDIEDNLKKWSGSHLFDAKLIPGVLFSNKAINTETPSILDLTPTILKIIGYNEDEIRLLDFDGEPLLD